MPQSPPTNVSAVPNREDKIPLAVRITVNPEMDHLVICIGSESVGLTYEDALVMGQQVATALQIIHGARTESNVTKQ